MSTGRCRCWSGRCRAGRRATGRSSVSCSARTPRPSPRRRPAGSGWSTPGAGASTARPTPPPELAGLAAAAGRPGPPRAVQPAGRHLGPGAGRPGRADGLLWTWPPGWATAGDPSTWAVVVGALALCDRVVLDGDRPALEAGGAGPARSPPGRGSAGTRPPARASGPRRCGPWWWPPSAPSAPTRRSGPRRPGASTPRAAGPADRRPTSRRPCWPPWPPSCARGTTRRCWPATARPATPQDELRYLNALAAFPDPALAVRTFELAAPTRSAARTRPT